MPLTMDLVQYLNTPTTKQIKKHLVTLLQDVLNYDIIKNVNN